ncbi:MAG: squalene/phytoene synthase family protein [Gammaproteobacteria bacterium]
MNPAEEARRKLACAPADLRFAALFAPRAQRQALTALLAVYLEIREIPHACSDAGVARAKLEWWREEIALLAAHRARHPLAINLAASLPESCAPTAALSGFANSAATDIAPPAFQRFEELEYYCQCRGGALTQLAAQCAGAQRSATLQLARNLGIAWQLAEIVLQVGVHAQHGRVYFAHQDFDKYGIDRHVVGDAHTASGLKALLDDYARRTRAYAQEPADRTVIETHTLTAARVVSSLALMRLKKFSAGGYDTAHAPVELQPLARLLTAWRAARWSRIG